MVDRQKRDIAAEVLRRFLDGSITNDDFMSQFPIAQHDPALLAIRCCVWGYQSDFRRYKLTGKYAPKPDAKALLERCWLFLKGNFEFEWPIPKTSILLGLLSFLTFGWLARRYEKKLKPLGNFDVWPFLRRADYEALIAGQASPVNDFSV